jgi:hypothetical protein
MKKSLGIFFRIRFQITLFAKFQKQETLAHVKNIQVTWKSLILGFQSLSY